jgi:hypothetical protein
VFMGGISYNQAFDDDRVRRGDAFGLSLGTVLAASAEMSLCGFALKGPTRSFRHPRYFRQSVPRSEDGQVGGLNGAAPPEAVLEPLEHDHVRDGSVLATLAAELSARRKMCLPTNAPGQIPDWALAVWGKHYRARACWSEPRKEIRHAYWHGVGRYGVPSSGNTCEPRVRPGVST